jgi:hypothetical protein
VTSTSPQRVEARDAGEYPPQHEADPAALTERAHAETAEAGDAVHEVALVGRLERLGPAARDDPGGDALGVRGLDGVERALAKPAVDPQARARTDLDVDVRGSLLHGKSQQSVQLQHEGASVPCIGASGGRL